MLTRFPSYPREREYSVSAKKKQSGRPAVGQRRTVYPPWESNRSHVVLIPMLAAFARGGGYVVAPADIGQGDETRYRPRCCSHFGNLCRLGKSYRRCWHTELNVRRNAWKRVVRTLPDRLATARGTVSAMFHQFTKPAEIADSPHQTGRTFPIVRAATVSVAAPEVCIQPTHRRGSHCKSSIKGYSRGTPREA